MKIMKTRAIRSVILKETEKAIETMRIFIESQHNIDQDSFIVIAELQKYINSKNSIHKNFLTDIFFEIHQHFV